MSNVKFWSRTNFFSAHAFAGLIEGVTIGIGFALTLYLLNFPEVILSNAKVFVN